MRPILGVPYVPPSPGPDPWAGVTMVWESPDGDVWEMSGRGEGGLWLQAGVRGVGMPEYAHQEQESAGVDGSQWLDTHAKKREVFWPILIWQDGSSVEWLDYDSAFWSTMDPRRPGRWIVTRPDGRSRYLTCRYVSGGDAGWEKAPGSRAWAPYGVYLQAEEPFWQGRRESRWFAAEAPVDFFSTDPGVVLRISEGSTLASASITNGGDEPAWATTWVVGPTTSVTVGVGSRVVEVPFAVASGRMLVVDSSPRVRTAREIDAFPVGSTDDEQEAWVRAHLPSATSRTIELGTVQWAPIPAGESVSLALTMVGAGFVRVSVVPQHRRAW